MRTRIGICALLLTLSCGSTAQAAVFCATSGNQINTALAAAAFNGEDDTIKVATGTHITDRYAIGDYQWQFKPSTNDYADSLTISGGWNAANNCQTQSTLDPAQTVLDARYWGKVFTAQMNFADFTGTLQISNLTFYRGETSSTIDNAGILIISERGNIIVDNILVTAGRSGANSARLASFQIDTAGTLKVRNSQFLNNSFTHSFSGGVLFQATNGAIGIFTNNSISGNTATIDRMGLEASGIMTLSNNAIGGNSSTASPSYDFLSDAPTSLTLTNNHFQTVGISNGVPASNTNGTTGDPQWTLVGARMVPDAVSPLRDSGDNTPTGGVPNIDFSGQPRIVNVIIDRGAVEADAPVGVATGPLVTANYPANGSTTVLKGITGVAGEFVSTSITFNVSGGTAPGTTKIECSNSGDVDIGSSGNTVAVGGSADPILVGFNLYGAQLSGVVSCDITRDNSSGYTLTYNFIGVPLGSGGPAIFDSSPKKSPDPASTIELTNGNTVPVGTDVLPKALTLYNIAEPGDSDMQVQCSRSGGSSPQISDTPVVNGDFIQPQGSLQVSFDCDTSTAGSYFLNYSCSYDLDDSQEGFTDDGSAQYRVECEVREQINFNITKVYTDGNLTEVPVEVVCYDGNTQGSKASMTSNLTATLSYDLPVSSCNVTETTVPDGYAVSYSAGCSVGALASETSSDCTITNTPAVTFSVNKTYSDGNPTAVDVTLNCPGATVEAPAERSVVPGIATEWVVTNLQENQTCTATETAAPAGYTADSSNCEGVPLAIGAPASCTINNQQDPVDLLASKIFTGGGGVATFAIDNCGGNVGQVEVVSNSATPGSPAHYIIHDFPYTGATCNVTEPTPPGGYYEIASSCNGLVIVPSDDDTLCDITNAPTRATFDVSKIFNDDDDGGPPNPTEVDVTISCFTGLPLIQTQTIDQSQGVKFVVEDFTHLELDCDISEALDVPELEGYTPTYWAGGTPGGTPNGSSGELPCHFENVPGGSGNTCQIVNDADPVLLDIEKLWVIEGSGGEAVDQHFELTLYCDAYISGGDKRCHGQGGGHGVEPSSLDAPDNYSQNYESCMRFEGNGSDEFTAWVTPEWPNSHCWVDEEVYDDSVEVDNGCGDLTVSHGSGDSCLITNTVFFEGIPTLSQYGLAIMALLMLGVGLVGFRRIL